MMDVLGMEIMNVLRWSFPGAALRFMVAHKPRNDLNVPRTPETPSACTLTFIFVFLYHQLQRYCSGKDGLRLRLRVMIMVMVGRAQNP
jgi:hypothetical protein